MKFRNVGRELRPVKQALVLSGGGAKGAYQIGVIKGMLSLGFKFDLVTGSSIGAFNGALLAEFMQQGMDREEIGQKLLEVWSGVGDFLTLNYWGFLRNIFSPRKIPSIYSNKEIKRVLSNYIPGNRSFSDYRNCQLSVTGTNLDSQDLHIFDYNSPTPVIRAVLASMAYPGALPSICIDDNHYIDGGALDNAPLKEAILWGAETIYLVFLKPLRLIREGKWIQNQGSRQGVSRGEEQHTPALEVITELIDMATNKMMYGDLCRAEKVNQLIKILNHYQDNLPRGFLNQIHQLFSLKFSGGKRIINIIKIAPSRALDPPGTTGFNQDCVLQDLIRQGEEDIRQILRC